ncbi:DUF2182 domain-containing protein [Roseobacter sp. HKCCA0434]|uniref:DUF2182 domain-containing protein n=1 Tax=Roseobacter sp. HKCCA0434 TaxID=3079297 RepID=UPI002905E618|nr:DUF2182 domain-containing protein [Roseobacter sp. HKCCA0434]
MDRLLLRTRAAAWLAFFVLCLGSWAMLYVMARDMGVGPLGFPRMSMDGDMAMGGTDMTRLLPLFGMWAIMMAAMMLPTFVPTARVFMDLIEAEIARPVGLWGLATGYVWVWLGVAWILAGAQVLFVRLGLTGVMGQSLSLWFSAALLLAAGAYQFTALKEFCAERCRSPMGMFLQRFAPGLRGGIRLGLRQGIYCAGCCWGLMAIGFAGGTMSLLWMGLATLLMVLEKLPEIGRWLTVPIGLGLLGLGTWVGWLALTA